MFAAVPHAAKQVASKINGHSIWRDTIADCVGIDHQIVVFILLWPIVFTTPDNKST